MSGLKKILIIAGVFTGILFVVVLLFMVTGSSDYKTILNRYNKAGNVEGNGVGDKKLNFLVSYEAETGDFQLSFSLGKKTDNSATPGVGGSSDPDPGTGGSTGPTGVAGWDNATVDDAILKHCTDWGGYDTDIWKKVVHNGNTYIIQKQRSNNAVGKIQNTAGELIGSNGCMFYAISAAASNIKHEVIGCEDVVKSLGYAVTYVPKEFSNHPPLTRNGYDSGKKHANGTKCTPQDILSSLGINAKYIGSKSPGADLDIPDVGNNCLYLVHVNGDTGGKLSGSGQHWFCIVGMEGDNFLLVGGGGSAANSQKASKSLLKSVSVNHIIKVEG